MSNYTPATNFAAKDALASGNPAKIVKGTEISAEFSAIQTAINSKYDSSTTIPISGGGTGATSAATALAALGGATAGPLASSGITGAAASGANSDITSLTALASINGGQLAGLRNRIINGNARVAQRGTVALVANAWTYGGADRIQVSTNGFTTASGSILAQSMAGTSSGIGQYATVTTTGSGNIAFGQKIEATNCIDLNSKAIIISGKLGHDSGVSQAAVVRLFKAGTVDSWGSPTQIGSDVSIGSIPTGVTTSFSASITLGANDATNGLWVTVYFTSVGAVTSKSFAISDLQLEVGAVATPFEHRPYGLELALCQRYLPVASAGSAYIGLSATSTSAYASVKFPISSRVAPTGITVASLTGYSATNGSGSPISATNVAYSVSVGVEGGLVRFDVASGLTVGQASVCVIGTSPILFTGCEL